MALGVGISENVVIKNVELQSDDKNTSLNFTFIEVDPEGGAKNFFDELEAEGTTDTGAAGLTIRAWAPKVEPLDYNQVAKSDTTKAEEAGKQIAELKNMMYQYLELFTTKDNIKFVPFAGTGVDRDNYNDLVYKDEILKAVFINMSNQFVAQMKPFLNKLDTPVRLLLVRQSAKKHYPSFRRNFLLQNPIVELMVIPKEASKLKFTKYELEKKLNDGTPTQQADADSVDTSETTQQDFHSIFSGK